MYDIANCSFHLSNSQGMSDLMASIGNYDIMLILRGVEPSGWTYVAT